MSKEANPHEIEKLPIKYVRIGNEIKRVRYDAVNKIIYRLNDDDTWDGSFVKHDLDSVINPCQENCENAATELSKNGVHTSVNHPAEELKMPLLDISVAQTETPVSEVTVSSDTNKDRDDSSKDTPMDLTKDTVGEPSENPAEEHPKKKSPLKKAFFPILCATLFVLIGLSLWGSVQDKIMQNLEDTTATEDSSITPNETISHFSEDPSLDDTQSELSDAAQIQVLAPNITLIPGQKLTAEIIDYIEITAEEYQLLSSAAGIYTSEELVSLDGLIAQNYIPAGRYLTYNDIGRAYTPTNPWLPDFRDSSTIMLPIIPTVENLQDFIWGNRIDLTITIQTKQTNTNDAQNAEETTPGGLEHESSVVESMVIDTYKLQNVQIADIQNSEQQSLYTRYAALSAIPSALQVDYLQASYSDAAIFQADIPAYIIIAVTQAQADVINSLDAEAMAITVSNPSAENKTSLQYDTYLKIQEVLSSIAAAWPQLSEEGAEP